MAQAALIRIGIKGIVKYGEDIVKALIHAGDVAGFNGDHHGRSDYVQKLLHNTQNEVGSGHFVMVINHASHYKSNLQGVSEDFYVPMGRGGGYRVIVFTHGHFELDSDGGWENWGFTGGRFGRFKERAMSITMLAYALFAIWGVVAVVALVMTDLSARRSSRALRVKRQPLTVIARADGTSTPAAAYRRATG